MSVLFMRSMPRSMLRCKSTLGVDVIIVSNYGGRNLDGAIAPIEAFPAIAASVGWNMTVMMDSASPSLHSGAR